MRTHSNVVRAPKEESLKPRWKTAWERLQQQYEEADELVIAVREGTRSLADPEVVTGLLTRYGRFNMANEQLAFGATMGVIELMLGRRFGDQYRCKFETGPMYWQFCKMFTGSSVRSSNLLQALQARAASLPAASLPEAKREQRIRHVPVYAPEPPPEVRRPAGPKLADLERLVETYMLDNPDMELAVQVTGARVLSASGIPLAEEFIQATILKVQRQKAEETRRREVDEQRRRLLESGDLVLQTFGEAPLPQPPAPEGVGEEEEEEEEDDEAPDDDDEPEGESEALGDDRLLAELDVPVSETDRVPDGATFSDEEDGPFEATTPQPEEDDVSLTALNTLMTRARAALTLIDVRSTRPQLAVFGVFAGKPFPSHPFLQCFDVLSDRVRSGARLDSQFRAAIILLEVNTEAASADRTGVHNSITGAWNKVESVWAVPRAQFIELLAEITGSTAVKEEEEEEEEEIEEEGAEDDEPASEPIRAPAVEPVAAPQEAVKNGRAPRVVFRPLGVGEFASDPAWTHMRFAAEQVATLPHGLSPTEIGCELARRAGLVGRKCTVGGITVAFANHLLKKREDATTLEMVTAHFAWRTNSYKVEPYVVPAGGKAKSGVGKKESKEAEDLAPEEAPVPTTVTTTAPVGGRQGEIGDFFAEEIPRLPKGLDQSKWVGRLYALPNAPKVDKGAFRDRFYRWRRKNRGIVPAGVDPVANGHPAGSAPPPVVHEEPASPPAPVPAEPVEPPAPPPVADPAPPAPPAPVVHEEPAPAPAPAPVPEAPAPPAVVPSQPEPSQAASVPDALTTMMAEFLARTEFIAGCAVRAEHERLTSRVKDVEHRNALLERFLADNPGMRAGFELFVREASRTHGSSH